MTGESAELLIFYERESGEPLAVLSGDLVCFQGDPQYSLEQFQADLGRDGVELTSFLLVEVGGPGELRDMIDGLRAGRPAELPVLGPFPMALLGNADLLGGGMN